MDILLYTRITFSFKCINYVMGQVEWRGIVIWHTGRLIALYMQLNSSIAYTYQFVPSGCTLKWLCCIRKLQLALLRRMRYDRFSIFTPTLLQASEFSKGVRCNCGFLIDSRNTFKLSRNRVSAREPISAWSFTSHKLPYEVIVFNNSRIYTLVCLGTWCT